MFISMNSSRPFFFSTTFAFVFLVEVKVLNYIIDGENFEKVTYCEMEMHMQNRIHLAVAEKSIQRIATFTKHITGFKIAWALPICFVSIALYC